MFTEAIRHAAEWGLDLAGKVLGFDLKDLIIVAGILMGGTWFVAAEFNARDERAAATESDIRVLSRSVGRMNEQIGDLAERQDSMDRRMIQYHQIYLEKMEELGVKLDRGIDIPHPYQGDDG